MANFSHRRRIAEALCYQVDVCLSQPKNIAKSDTWRGRSYPYLLWCLFGELVELAEAILAIWILRKLGKSDFYTRKDAEMEAGDVGAYTAMILDKLRH